MGKIFWAAGFAQLSLYLLTVYEDLMPSPLVPKDNKISANNQTLTESGLGEVVCAYLKDIKYVPALAILIFHST